MNGNLPNDHGFVGIDPAPSQNVPPQNAENALHALIFNNEHGAISVSRMYHPDFAYDLTEEQFSAIFPTLNHAYFNASVSYTLPRGDFFQGLTEVFAHDTHNAYEGVQIRLSEFSVPDTHLIMDEEHHVSYVHDIAVNAFISTGYGMAGGEFVSMYAVRANFTLDNIAYSISYANVDTDAAKLRLTEIVNEIIIGGAADWSVLADPVVPELRDEELTLEQARLDADFGAFMPANIPENFIFDSGRRMLNQWDNSIRANWHSFPRLDNIFWVVGEPQEHELQNIVSAADSYKYDVSLYSIPWFDSVPDEIRNYFHNPVFLAEEMSLEVVQARTRPEEGRRGSSGDLVTDEFAILYGDVIIRVSARGVSAEQLWEMIPMY